MTTMIVFFQHNAKVAVLGASGGIGQPMSLLLKQNPRITELSLYDVAHTPGVAAAISHCSTRAKVTGHLGPDELAASLKSCDVVVIPAGVPRKPGMVATSMHICHLGLFTLYNVIYNYEIHQWPK